MLTVDYFQSTSAASLLRIRSCWLVKKKIPKHLRKRSGLPSAHGLVFLRTRAVNGLALTSGPRWTVGLRKPKRNMEMTFPAMLGKCELLPQISYCRVSKESTAI